MQEMAPGSNVALHAGHVVAAGCAAAGWAGGFAGAVDCAASGLAGAADCDAGGFAAGAGAALTGGVGLAAPTPAVAGSRAGARRTVNACLQLGQRTCFPPASAGT